MQQTFPSEINSKIIKSLPKLNLDGRADIKLLRVLNSIPHLRYHIKNNIVITVHIAKETESNIFETDAFKELTLLTDSIYVVSPAIPVGITDEEQYQTLRARNEARTVNHLERAGDRPSDMYLRLVSGLYCLYDPERKQFVDLFSTMKSWLINGKEKKSQVISIRCSDVFDDLIDLFSNHFDGRESTSIRYHERVDFSSSLFKTLTQIHGSIRQRPTTYAKVECKSVTETNEDGVLIVVDKTIYWKTDAFSLMTEEMANGTCGIK